MVVKMKLCVLLIAVSIAFDVCYGHCTWETIREDKQFKIFLGLLENYADKINDVVFVLDESGSIGLENFKTVISFTKLIARQFFISSSETRPAVMTFSTSHTIHFDYINDPNFKNMCTFLNEMLNVNYKGGGTNTDDALVVAEEILHSGRSSANRLIVILTDGESNDGLASLEPIVTKLKASSVIIFVVGVGNTKRSELEFMATSEDHIYYAKSFLCAELYNDLITTDVKFDSHDKADVNLCTGSCDVNADCYCGTRTGVYTCSCIAGYFGNSGFHDQCKPCPFGSYKNSVGNIHCTSCGPFSTTLTVGCTSISECICIEGYEKNSITGLCQPVQCLKLKPPTNGIIWPANCDNIYGSRCHYKCNEGYCPYSCTDGPLKFIVDKIVGPFYPWDTIIPNPRICQKTGLWSGQEFFCEKMKCPPLKYPLNGNHNCSGNETDFTFGTICHMTCDEGYFLKGSTDRTCLINGTWTGKETTCSAITCDPLKTNENLRLKPSKCGKGKMLYQSTCTYYCLEGFALTSLKKSSNALALGVRHCQLNGKWSVNETKEKLYCKDIEPPTLRCPESIQINTDPGKSTAYVDWLIPRSTDNVDVVFPEIIEPRILYKPPYSFPIGFTKVVYRAMDNSGNINTCSFSVTIYDIQPPILKCPENILKEHPNRTGVNVTWDEPTYSDNSGVVNLLPPSRKSGELFKWGPSSVISYSAVDQSGNKAHCSFTVTVKPYSCEYVEPPANGYLTCDKWTNGQLCGASCKEGYAFPVKTESVYFCSQKTLKWEPPPNSNRTGKFIFPWPDCSAIKEPKGMNISVEVAYKVTNCSNENVENAKKDFIERLKAQHKFFCPVDKGCHVKNVEVTCKRRVEVNSNLNRIRRNIDKADIRKKRQDSITSRLSVSFDIEIDDINEICKNCSAIEIVKELEKTLDLHNVVVPGVSETVNTVYKIDEPKTNSSVITSHTIAPICENGSLPLNESCVNCPVGTYFDSNTRTCKSCPKNFVMYDDGAILCIRCPPNHITLQEGSKKFQDCKGPCQPGTFSKNGYQPCIPCPKGFFKQEKLATSCLPCPKHFTTTTEGASTALHCVAPCEMGSYSENGFTSCLPCPRGTYQPMTQQTSCLKCPLNTTTLVEGAFDASYCQSISYCKDLKPCSNNGTCKDSRDGYTCKCLPGFGGKDCDINLNDCTPDSCENNGTCLDGVNQYTCFCRPGYTGLRCERDIDDCENGTCNNGGICHDLLGGYSCECPEGFTGQHCEINVDDCASNPCLNNGVCFDMTNGYRCCCPNGYTGLTCDSTIDFCLEDPCVNGGICASTPEGFTCGCPLGFNGTLCEININDCTADSCKNGGICQDGIDNFTCTCPPFYQGLQCGEVVPSGFSVEFPTKAEENYVLLLNPKFLYGITVSFFMKVNSDDPESRLTPVSYSYKNTKTGTIHDNSLTLYDMNKITLYLHGVFIPTGYIANKDFLWHHYAVTWDSLSGQWNFFVDGSSITSGKIDEDKFFYPGVFVLGQEQDELGGGFKALESFVGIIAEFNVWDFAFTEDEIRMLAESCDYYGNVIAWPEAFKHLNGDLKVHDVSDICSNKGKCDEESCYCQSQGNNSGVCRQTLDSCESCVNSEYCAQNNRNTTCICDVGFTGRFCEYDIDECLINNGNCSHECVNSNGSYICTCPQDMSLQADGRTCKDISICMMDGNGYLNGEEWKSLSTCRKCKCDQGHISCKTEPCPELTCEQGAERMLLPGHCCDTCISNKYRCIIHPNNTIGTFDGFVYKFRDYCRNTLLQENFDGTFIVKLEANSELESSKMLGVYAFCTNVSILSDGRVVINRVAASLPYKDSHLTVESQLTKEHFHIKITMKHAAILNWHSNGTIVVELQESFKGRIKGLCGNFNENSEDDLVEMTNDADAFSESCSGESSIGNPEMMAIMSRKVEMASRKRNWITLNCPNLDDTFKALARNACSVFWSADFRKCHDFVSPTLYHMMCLKWACESGYNSSYHFCNSIVTYVAECAKNNITITDMDSAGICSTHCGGGMEFKNCGTMCPVYCKDFLHNKTRQCSTTWQCEPKCYCPPDYVLYRWRCISKSECFNLFHS